MPATAIKPTRTTPRPSTAAVARCRHLRADRKRCADAVYPGHASLCHYHLNQEMRGVANGNIIAADILHSIGNFQSAAAINIALGKILIYQLTGRISRQDAMALSYQCQLLLQTLPLIQQELKETGFSSYWRDETRRILGESSDLDQITFPSLLPDSDVPLHPKNYVDPKSSAALSASPQTANPQSHAPCTQPSAPATSDRTITTPHPSAAMRPSVHHLQSSSGASSNAAPDDLTPFQDSVVGLPRLAGEESPARGSCDRVPVELGTVEKTE